MWLWDAERPLRSGGARFHGRIRSHNVERGRLPVAKLAGHSERRHGLGETDDFLNRKAKAALEAGLSVIFCIGETLAQREGASNRGATLICSLLQGWRGCPVISCHSW